MIKHILKHIKSRIRHNEDGDQLISFQIAFPAFMFLTILLWVIGSIGYEHNLIQGTLNETINQAGAYNIALPAAAGSYGYNQPYSNNFANNTCTDSTNPSNAAVSEAANVSQMEQEANQIAQQLYSNVNLINPTLTLNDTVCVVTVTIVGGVQQTSISNSTSMPPQDSNGPSTYYVTLSAQESVAFLGNYTFNASAVVAYQHYHCNAANSQSLSC